MFDSFTSKQNSALNVNLTILARTQVSFWTNKRVVVTGGAGFLGSVVVEQLRQRGCRCICVPRAHDYDLARMEGVRRLYADTRPNLVIHLPSPFWRIGVSKAQTGGSVYDNFMIATQLMEVGRRQGVEKFVVLTRICAHPKLMPVFLPDQSPRNASQAEANEPCDLANKMLLVQVQAYRQRYGFNSVVLSPVNVYGPCDNFDMQTSQVIPALIRTCVDAQERGERQIVLRDNGLVPSEYLYVDDAAEGIVLAAGQCGGDVPVNLGTGEEITIRPLAELVAAAVGFEGELIWDSGESSGEPHRCLDVSTAKQLFCFEPRWELSEGIRKTVSWFRSHRIYIGK